jgi:hypothetical protein
MEGLTGAHEKVVAAMLSVQPKLGSHLFEITDNVVRLLFWGAPGALSGALDVYAMLICAGEKERLHTLLSFVSGNRVAHDHGVKMTKMRQAVGVVDRCG